MIRVEAVNKSFGGLKAVAGISFDLGPTAITGLVGPNGSGKTTLFHLITGLYRLDSGKIFFQDKPIHGLPPFRISRMGLVRTFQNSRVLPFLSVRDNLLAAAPRQAGEGLLSIFLQSRKVKREEAENCSQARDILAFLKLSHLADQPAGRLSYGQQKLMELGRMLMARPKIILLDEPTAGLNPTLIRQITALILELRQQGIHFFLVEHNMPLVAELCDKLLAAAGARSEVLRICRKTPNAQSAGPATGRGRRGFQHNRP